MARATILYISDHATSSDGIATFPAVHSGQCSSRRYELPPRVPAMPPYKAKLLAAEIRLFPPPQGQVAPKQNSSGEAPAL
jgi:hypothetical protein